MPTDVPETEEPVVTDPPDPADPSSTEGPRVEMDPADAVCWGAGVMLMLAVAAALVWQRTRG
jgi:hypothetical protein